MTLSPDNLLAAAASADTSDCAALAAAFEAFNRVSTALEASYRDLEREARRLRSELAGATRERAEKSRRNAALAGQLSALLEALPGAVLLIGGHGRVQQANSAAAALLGAPVLGEHWATLRERSFRRAPTNASDLELNDGRRVQISQKPLQPGPGRVLLITDVTGKRKIEDLLARHRRLAAMGEMAAALAHQIRTPLAAGLLYATNANRPGLPAGQRENLLDRAVACLHDLEKLIGDMLQFARGANLAGQPFTLEELLDSVETSLRPTLLAGQRLIVDRPAARVRLNGNREALAGALLNLATNALQAAGEDARVHIIAHASRLQAEVNVIDNGPGVAAEIAAQIFEPFFTSRPDGTGLGLAVARSVARAHRGDVTLAATRAGATTFSLRLPLDARMQSGPDAGRNAAA